MLFDEVNTPEFRDRVEKRKQLKQRLQDEYSPKLWDRFKKKIRSRKFPSKKIEDLLASDSSAISVSTGRHFVEKEKHSTDRYSYYEDIACGLLGVEWSYEYCVECGEVVSRYGVLLNAIENVAVAYRYSDSTVEEVPPLGNFEEYLFGGLEQNVDEINAGIMPVSEIIDPLNFYNEVLPE